MTTTEQETVTTDIPEQQLDHRSLESDVEKIAERMYDHFTGRALNKFIAHLEQKALLGEKVFDQNQIQEAIEVAAFIANLSQDEKTEEIAADLRDLGRDYAKFQKAKGVAWFRMLPKLQGELERLKSDIRGLSVKNLFRSIWRRVKGWTDWFILWFWSKTFGILLAIFLSFPKRQRMSHNNGIGAKGTFQVVPHPTFPAHEFFAPGRVFPLRIRHASATFLDDAMNCIRSISVKLADEHYKSPFDLQMNSGETSLFWSAKSFWKFAVLRKEKYGIEYREFNRKYPEGLEASKIATRRHVPFERLYYYCKTPFLYNSSEGEKYFAKYRVIPHDRAADAGIKTDRSDWDECNQRVANHETRGRNFLKYAYEDLVEREGKVRYWLQIQLRKASDEKDDAELCNNMVVWDEELYPWHDLGMMEVTETLDWRESTLTSFSVNNMPKGLGVIPAKSMYDYNSLNYMRSHAEIAYKARLWSYKFFGMVPPIPDNDNRNVSDWGE